MTASPHLHAPMRPAPTVMEPLSEAIEVVKRTLFQPFDITRWFILGFCAFLSQCGRGGGGGQGGCRGPGGPGGGPGGGPDMSEIQNFLGQWMWLILLGAASFWLLFVGIVLLTQWLGSRGDFIFLANIARNEADISHTWDEMAAPANSLFKLRAVIFLGFLGLGTVATIIAGIPLYQDVMRTSNSFEFSTISIILMVVSGILLFFLSIGVALFHFFINHIVIPVMYARRLLVGAALRDARGLLARHSGTMFLYLLMRMVVAVAIGVIVMFGTCLTCCIGGLPYISSVLFLPLWVFHLAYSAKFVEQFGPEYTMFAPEPVVMHHFPGGGGCPGAPPAPNQYSAPYGYQPPVLPPPPAPGQPWAPPEQPPPPPPMPPA